MGQDLERQASSTTAENITLSDKFQSERGAEIGVEFREVVSE